MDTTTAELKEQLRLLEEIEAKMRSICELWVKMPSQDQLDEMSKEVDFLEDTLRSVKQLWSSGNVPSVATLEEMLTAAKQVAGYFEQMAKNCQDMERAMDELGNRGEESS